MQGHRIVYQQVDKINADHVARFFCCLRKHHPEKYKIHIILDKAGYHKNPVLPIFDKNLAIQIHYLPQYSPNLNPIEGLWKIMRENVFSNQ